MTFIHSDIIFQKVGYIQDANFSWLQSKQGNADIFFKHKNEDTQLQFKYFL